MLKPYPLEVVTTIAYHPKGRELHLRNLNWALRGIPHKITVLTFESYGFKPLFDEVYVECRAEGYYDFHGFHLKDVLRGGSKHFLLMQQDVFFHQPLTFIPSCLQYTGEVYDAYFSLFDQKGGFMYPRLWEGGFFMPGELLRRAIREGVHMGYNYQWAVNNLADSFFLTTNYSTKGGILFPVKDKILKSRWTSDKLVDFTLFAAYREEPIEDPLCLTYHLSGPEHTHMFFPDSYRDESYLARIANGEFIRPASCSAFNIALMYLLAGVLPESNIMADSLKRGWRPAFRRDFEAIYRRAEEWMSPEQFKKLSWAKDQCPMNSA